MATKTSASRSPAIVTGCRAPGGIRSHGSVTSTASSSSTRWSRSASRAAVRSARACLTSPRALPTRLPASARACGGSAPISALASVSGALSPKRAIRAFFSSSSVCAAAMAASASSRIRVTSTGDSAVTSTGS